MSHSPELSYAMVLIAGILPYLFTVIAKVKHHLHKPYNNRDPRSFMQDAEGMARRAHNTQLNSFEAFPFFAVGVLIVHLKSLEGSAIDWEKANYLSTSFVTMRVLYGWAYLSDRPALRSVIWFTGIVSAGLLYLL